MEENNIINDIPTIIPELDNESSKLFEDEFKNKWYNRYKEGGCTLDHIQRLYNLDKITIEDFKLITGEEPGDKVVQQPSELSKLKDRVNSLESELETTKQENAELYYELMTSGVI